MIDHIIDAWHEQSVNRQVLFTIPTLHSTQYPLFVEKELIYTIPTLLHHHHSKTQEAMDKVLEESLSWNDTEYFLRKQMARALHRLYSDRTACKITQTVFYCAALEVYNEKFRA